jgi:hypothetical protein
VAPIADHGSLFHSARAVASFFDRIAAAAPSAHASRAASAHLGHEQVSLSTCHNCRRTFLLEILSLLSSQLRRFERKAAERSFGSAGLVQSPADDGSAVAQLNCIQSE